MEIYMKISFLNKTLALILVMLLLFPTLLACGRKITLDDAKYTMSKLFSALSDSDYEGVVKLMHKSSGITESDVASFLSEVESRVGGHFDDGISNIRYTSHEELSYNGVPGGSKFRVFGTFNIGKAKNVSFAISLIMDSDGYGINLIDFDGLPL